VNPTLFGTMDKDRNSRGWGMSSGNQGRILGFRKNCHSLGRRRRTVLHVVGYCGLILLEAVSVGTSVSSQTGTAGVAALVIGLIAAVPTANHCSGWLFTQLTRGWDGEL